MILLLFAFLTFPLTCYAAGVNYWGYTLKAFGSLLLVFGLIVAFFYILKKINTMGRYTSARIKLKSKLYLDNKHYVAIVEIDNKEFVLGVGENVTVLKEFGEGSEEN